MPNTQEVAPQDLIMIVGELTIKNRMLEAQLEERDNLISSLQTSDTKVPA